MGGQTEIREGEKRGGIGNSKQGIWKARWTDGETRGEAGSGIGAYQKKTGRERIIVDIIRPSRQEYR